MISSLYSKSGNIPRRDTLYKMRMTQFENPHTPVEGFGKVFLKGQCALQAITMAGSDDVKYMLKVREHPKEQPFV